MHFIAPLKKDKIKQEEQSIELSSRGSHKYEMQANIAFLVPAHESGGWLRGWVASPVSCKLSFPLESNTDRNVFPYSPCIYNVNSILSRPCKTFIRISSSSQHI